MSSKILAITVAISFVSAAVLIGPAPRSVYAAEEEEAEDTEVLRGLSSTDPDSPNRHFRMRQVAELEPAEVARIYDLIQTALAKGYASSGFEGSESYQSLKRYNSAPYLSASHGNHYLNNYVNDIGVRYGEFEKAGRLPQGSVIFKDSFSVAEAHQDFSATTTRQIVLGPLFVMRKMEPGFNRVTGDWQYIQIEPDGTLIGMTGGEGAEHVEYCIGCHLAREDFDHLYFIPEALRPTNQ